MAAGLDQKATRQQLAAAFKDTAVQFAESAIAAWPEDALLPAAAAELRSVDATVLLEAAQRNFGKHIAALNQKDPKALFEVGRHEQLAILNFEAKYAGANSATQDTVWAYVSSLCKFVSMYGLYGQIPTGILSVVNGTAFELKSAIEAGAMDVNSINPMELGQRVMAQINPKEMENFMNAIMQDQDAMMNMMSQMSNIVGGPGAVLAQGGGLGALQSALQATGGGATPDLDIASMLKFMKR